MSVKNPKFLVIDASVARAAGKPEPPKTPSSECSEFLEEMLHSGHKIIFTRDIIREWDFHQSTFSVEWRANMISRGRVKFISDDTINDDLRDKILAVIPQETRANILKDMHLIEAAKLGDKIIASLDDKMREHFRRAAQNVTAIQAIVWVNPSVEDEGCIIWLRQSAPADIFRQLGYAPE